MLKYVNGVIVLIIVGFLISCGGSTRKVTRMQVDEATDISGRWNDTDARLTAESMVRDVLSKPWLQTYMNENGEKPVVIVGKIRNRTSEHLETRAFVNDIEKELINSGQITFVASAEERENIRQERLDQQSYASVESAKELANEQAADFTLQGSINSIVDSFDGKRTVTYIVDLELIDLETNTKVWVGNKKIKKFVEQDKLKW